MRYTIGKIRNEKNKTSVFMNQGNLGFNSNKVFRERVCPEFKLLYIVTSNVEDHFKFSFLWIFTNKFHKHTLVWNF